MLSLDESITHARDISAIQRNNDKLNKTLGVNSPYYKTDCLKCAEEHEQIAEWLEELKAYREIGTVEECKGCVLQILEAYIKGIDDFVEKLLEKAPRNYVGDLELGGSVSFLSANTVIKIAEQMKVGVSGERD